jgi:DNA polymerase III subunit epsilon
MSPSHSFTAIDFETAQAKRNSICQIGLIRVESGKIVKQVDILVQPPGNEYFYMNIAVHGISPDRTRNAPTFDRVWHMIEPFIKDQHVVAHNGSFDFSCLKKTLEHYSLATPDFEKHCTYKLYGKALKPLCSHYGIELIHHNALSDALACASLFMMHLKKQSELSI